MNIPADFIRDIGKHIEKKADLQRGDKEAWGAWFDRLEFYANLCNGVANKLEALDTAKDAVIEAAEKATRAWPGSGALTMPRLSKALAAYDEVRDE